MACIPLPAAPAIELPFPLTLGAAIPSYEFDPKLCCKILPFPLVTPPIPLPVGTLNPGVVAIVQANLELLTAYFDKLAFKCPRE